jgi:hypothetical protein
VRQGDQGVECTLFSFLSTFSKLTNSVVCRIGSTNTKTR